MQMHFCRHLWAIALTCAVGLAIPSVSEAALAKKLGLSYGGKLSTSSGSISTQQLTADPASIASGSMSTEYDPSLVSLSDLIGGPFFDVTALIGIRLPTDPPTAERFVSSTAYFAGLPIPYEETGYVQVSFMRKAGTTEQSIINPLPGYLLVDVDGAIDGDDTHALFFSAKVPGATDIASYHLYREDGTHHDVLPDYLINLDNETFLTDIGDATVSGALPEPAALSMLAAFGMLFLRRRRAA